MYNGMKKIEEVLLYIEKNITNDISCEELSKMMNLSIYEFRRIFAFVMDCPISEYIRKRRLSLAACEIAALGKADLPKLSSKYQYANQSAFTKAFKAHHGCTPTEYLKNSHDIQLFTLPRIEINISSGETVPLKIIKDSEFCISGYSGVSTITDSCCCENIWNCFYENEIDKALSADKIYVSYQNTGNSVNCCIGQKDEYGHKIPESRWACFKASTTDDKIINELYSKIIYEWLPSAHLKTNRNLPTIEVFPFDMSEEGFEWEIRIPIE